MKAANENDVWSQPVTVTLTYQPKWFQTWWFRLSLGLVLALIPVVIVYIIQRIRIKNIIREQEIRKDVAADLHDDIGSSLNSVKVFAHLAKTEPAQKGYIRSLEESLELANIGLRDMIWVLDYIDDSIDDLCQRLAQSSVKTADAVGIKVHFQMADGLRFTNLSKSAKRNLFLIIKETINNSVKYAECCNIWVDFQYKQNLKKLEVSVRDDGKGFDTSKVQQGNGLINMRNRAAQANFNCVIKSGEQGTEIVMTQK